MLRSGLSLRLLVVTPAVAIFLSSMLVNVGNLGFNMIFSRLMGPELFGQLAFLLTLKLSVLSLFGAAQMAVSHLVSDCEPRGRGALLAGLSVLTRQVFVLLSLVFLFAAIALWLWLGTTALPPVLLFAALPFGAAFSVLRGVSFGAMHTGAIILSANLEMGVRLIGALLAWQLGLGLSGVAGAIALSIIAGWAVVRRELPAPAQPVELSGLIRSLGLGGAAFALLQLAQVLALDGDIFLARSLLSAEDGGLIAALSLSQRIQFFACFSLATVLLPDLTRARRTGQPVIVALRPVGILFGAVSIAVLCATTMVPEWLTDLLVGPQYRAAAPLLRLAALSAIAFTLSYLIATALMAFGDRRGIWICLTVAVVQLAAMALIPEPHLSGFVMIKVSCQLAACGISLLLFAVRLKCSLLTTR
ncbi:O-antigen/teichoic acid export membrane protein [Celeribacter persicus]|uniref:O-antigen/teichoic acid export membrane protein n=2 Tax=Celeribacter persicus TaxID=1651082 RepID=A0A2T5H9U6_9RHOB|nr:O-antigen/teichoic acid export membrane protein [Celeribacter persicus]